MASTEIGGVRFAPVGVRFSPHYSRYYHLVTLNEPPFTPSNGTFDPTPLPKPHDCEKIPIL